MTEDNRCTCEGGHVLLCPAHVEEARQLLNRMIAGDVAQLVDNPEEGQR